MARFARTALTALAATALALPLAAPAGADALRYSDPSFDTTHPADMVGARVKHGDRVVITVRHRNLTFHDGPGYLRLAYDVGRAFDGPEFLVSIWYQTDRPIELRSAEGWGAVRGRKVPGCTGETAEVSGRRDVTRVSVPRSCLGNPRRVRVQLRLRPFPRDDRRADHLPAVTTSGPWVGR